MTSQEPQTSHEPVEVFSTSSDAEMAVAKSMLQAGDIPFFTKNEMIVDIMGAGRIGGGNRLTGPMEILVAPRDAEFAREILKGLDEDEHTGEDTVVFSTSREDELDRVKGLLDSADIPYAVTPKVVNRVTQAQILVPQSDLEAAQEQLSSLQL